MLAGFVACFTNRPVFHLGCSTSDMRAIEKPHLVCLIADRVAACNLAEVLSRRYYSVSWGRRDLKQKSTFFVDVLLQANSGISIPLLNNAA